MSTAPPRPAPPAPSADSRPKRRVVPTFDLSPAQLIATALAAVTATFAASFLGVTGTVLGAALFSVVTAVGKEVFGTSLRRTGTRVAATGPVTRVLPRVAAGSTDTDEAPPELPAPAPSPTPRLRLASLWKRVALVSVVVFVGVLACVTAVEVFAGRPVSDLVRGEAGKGTSFFGGQQVVTTRTVPPTTPTVTVTVTPKVSYTTPTVTQTAPPVTKSETPSSSAAPSTSATPSGTPSSAAGTSGSRTP